jgi:hypothetical protein
MMSPGYAWDRGNGTLGSAETRNAMNDRDDQDRGSPEVEYRDLQPVFRGSMPEVLTLQSALAANGIESFIPDYTIKTVDPLITGQNVFEVSLHVAAKRVAEAEAEIRRLRKGAAEQAAQPAEAGKPPEEPGAEPPEPERPEGLEGLGRRIRWASISVITAPVGVLWGIRYLGEVGALSEKPAFDLLTKVCFAICILESLSMAVLAVFGFGFGFRHV